MVSLDSEAIPTEIQLRPPGQVILVLGLLRPVLKVPIVNGFGVAYIIDTNDQRVHVGKSGLALEYEGNQCKADTG